MKIHDTSVFQKFIILTFIEGTSRFLAKGGGGRCPPPWLRLGGHFEIKEGQPDFLQIT